MRIGFDGKRLVFNNTGLGNYSRFLVEALSDTFPENQYIVFSKKHSDNPRISQLFQRKNVHFRTPSGLLGNLFSSLWRSIWIKNDIRKEKIDLYHGLSHEIPIGIARQVPSVVTVHDLVYLRFPQFYSGFDRMVYRLKTKYACRHAQKIVAVSECTKRDLIYFLDIPSDKITVVYQDCDPIFKKEYTLPEQVAVQKKYDLPNQYILSVGSIEKRKNLLLVLKALEFCDPTLHLVVIGKKTAYFDDISAFYTKKGLTDRVHILEDLPFTDLPLIYKKAQALVYPSRYEGFGIPIIEALYTGIPVIAATGSCLEEAGGPHSLYIHPDDEKALANAIITVTTQPEVRLSMIREGKNHVQRFDSNKIASDMMKVYEVARS